MFSVHFTDAPRNLLIGSQNQFSNRLETGATVSTDQIVHTLKPLGDSLIGRPAWKELMTLLEELLISRQDQGQDDL